MSHDRVTRLENEADEIRAQADLNRSVADLYRSVADLYRAEADLYGEEVDYLEQVNRRKDQEERSRISDERRYYEKINRNELLTQDFTPENQKKLERQRDQTFKNIKDAAYSTKKSHD